jgi:hypothetical protein
MKLNVERTTLVCGTVALAAAAFTLFAGCIGTAGAQTVHYGCIGTCNPGQGAAGTTTFQLTAIASGNWSVSGIHTRGNYQIGFSTQHPSKSISYFEFNFSPIQGRTVTAAYTLVPGSTDYDIGVSYTPKCPPANTPCFKVGMRSLLRMGVSVNEVVNGGNSASTGAALAGNQNDDLGYAWVEEGLHRGLQFSSDHYNPQYLQDEVNAGGDEVLLGGDDFDSGLRNLSGGGACPACPGGFENYIWGSTNLNSGIIALITVDGGQASIPVVPNGTYEVKNLNSGGALEVAGTAVDQHLDVASYGGDDKQMWKVTRLADGNYSIRNAGTGSLLQASKEWAIVPYTDGNYNLKSVKTGKMLDVADGGSLMGESVAQMAAKPGYASQQWSFQPGNAQQASLTVKSSTSQQ